MENQNEINNIYKINKNDMKEIYISERTLNYITSIPDGVDINDLPKLEKVVLGVLYYCYAKDNNTDGKVWVGMKFFQSIFRKLLKNDDIKILFDKLAERDYITLLGYSNTSVGVLLTNHYDVKKITYTEVTNTIDINIPKAIKIEGLSDITEVLKNYKTLERELAICKGVISAKDKEIAELKSRITLSAIPVQPQAVSTLNFETVYKTNNGKTDYDDALANITAYDIRNNITAYCNGSLTDTTQFIEEANNLDNFKNFKAYMYLQYIIANRTQYGWQWTQHSEEIYRLAMVINNDCGILTDFDKSQIRNILTHYRSEMPDYVDSILTKINNIDDAQSTDEDVKDFEDFYNSIMDTHLTPSAMVLGFTDTNDRYFKVIDKKTYIQACHLDESYDVF